MLYNLTKNERFLSFSVRVAEILSMRLSDKYDSFCRQIFHIYFFKIAEELFLLNQEHSCHVQLATTFEPWHISKVCLQNLILQIYKQSREIFNLLCLKIKENSHFK